MDQTRLKLPCAAKSYACGLVPVSNATNVGVSPTRSSIATARPKTPLILRLDGSHSFSESVVCAGAVEDGDRNRKVGNGSKPRLAEDIPDHLSAKTSAVPSSSWSLAL